MRVAEFRNGGYYIGKTGENATMTVPIPVGRWLQEYPGCQVHLAYKRPDRQDFYPVAVEIVGGNALWTVSETDVEVRGEGVAELQMVRGEQVEKSITYKIMIEQAAVVGATPSDPVKDYFLRMINAAEKITAMTAEATTLEPGAEATAEYDHETGIMSFGIPSGHDGTDGHDGVDGTDGVSPSVTVQEIPGGHTVNIADKDHPSGQTFEVADGVDGADGTDGVDGVSPSVSVQDITGGHRVTITDKDHPSGQSFDVLDGESGNLIDDTVTSAEKTWSSNKVNSQLSTINQAIVTLPTSETGSEWANKEELNTELVGQFVGEVDRMFSTGLPQESTMGRVITQLALGNGLLNDLYLGMEVS